MKDAHRAQAWLRRATPCFLAQIADVGALPMLHFRVKIAVES
jgi:hypothetical protein